MKSNERQCGKANNYEPVDRQPIPDIKKLVGALERISNTSTITIKLDGQSLDFQITHYSPALPATRWEPAEPEELEWHATDPAIQALIDRFSLHESVEELIVEQAERDRADAEEMSYDNE